MGESFSIFNSRQDAMMMVRLIRPAQAKAVELHRLGL